MDHVAVDPERDHLTGAGRSPTLVGTPPAAREGDAAKTPIGWTGGPVELDRVVPPSGNMWLAGKQFWLGPVRSGQVMRFWAGINLIHLFIGGTRTKPSAPTCR